jgi:hypothetical protein
VAEETPSPEWCVVGNLLPYPYSANGPHADFRSQKIFPAGAKLYVVGGFWGMGHETVTVVGYAHRRRLPVTAYIQAKYLGNWRAQLVYRPAVLRAIHAAAAEDITVHRWLYARPGMVGRQAEYQVDAPDYGDHLAVVAADFQRYLHRSR